MTEKEIDEMARTLWLRIAFKHDGSDKVVAALREVAAKTWEEAAAYHAEMSDEQQEQERTESATAHGISAELFRIKAAALRGKEKA